MLSGRPTPRQERLRVLVVDDEVEILELLGEYLRARGHEVHIARTGRDALGLLDDHEVDVVLTDLKMPDGNGLDLLAACQALRPAPMVIVMTGFGTVETATHALTAGAFDYLLKPFRLRDVYATLLRAAQSLEDARRTERLPRLVAFHESCLLATDLDAVDLLRVELLALARAEADANAATLLSRHGQRIGEPDLDPEALAREIGSNAAQGNLLTASVLVGGASIRVACRRDRGLSDTHQRRVHLLLRAYAAAVARL